MAGASDEPPPGAEPTPGYPAAVAGETAPPGGAPETAEGAVPVGGPRHGGGGGGGDRWLLVEADAVYRDTLVRHFADEDIELATARDAAHGRKEAEDDPPLVVIIDVELPDLHGFELARQLRASLGRDVPIIAVIDPRKRDEIRNCLRVGFDAYLPRPRSRDGLRDLARQLIDLGNRLLSGADG